MFAIDGRLCACLSVRCVSISEIQGIRVLKMRVIICWGYFCFNFESDTHIDNIKTNFFAEDVIFMECKLCS